MRHLTIDLTIAAFQCILVFMIKVRNKHAMLELLQEGVAFEKIAIVQNLEKDSLTEHILHEASKRMP